MKLFKKRYNLRAFSLIEILIVISIISVISGIALSIFQGPRDDALKTSLISQADSVMDALNILKASEGYYPGDPGLPDEGEYWYFGTGNGCEDNDPNLSTELVPDYIGNVAAPLSNCYIYFNVNSDSYPGDFAYLLYVPAPSGMSHLEHQCSGFSPFNGFYCFAN